MSNYDYIVSCAVQRNPSSLLDYGCGAGEIVRMLRDRGIDTYGCEPFYGGGDSSNTVPLETRPYVKRMPDGVIPFPSEYFEAVVTKQVFEHVRDIDFALGEIARVLKPGGWLLALFPDKGVWREGHCGIPFIHWLPKNQARTYYAAALRCVGIGYHTNGKSIMNWSTGTCRWLDDWTVYRLYGDIRSAFERQFRVQHLEKDWFDARLKARFGWSPPIPFKDTIVRKLAGNVMFCERV